MGLRRRSNSFRAFVKSNIIKFTGQIRNITIPEEPTPNLLSLESSPRTPVLEVRSSGLPDVCSATTLPLPKHFNLISGYGYSRFYGVKKGPHFNLTLARNYTKKSEEVQEQKWKVEGLTKSYVSDFGLTNSYVSDFPDLLFTENRDYLVKYNGQRVHADQLAEKVVVLFFAPLTPKDFDTRMCMISLVDTYNYLLPNNNFEVVFVAVESSEKEIAYGRRKIKVEPSKHFEELFSCMPWTAIPLSDMTARKHLQQRFGISDMFRNAIVIGTDGEILQTHSCSLFETYGGQCYPFTDTKILSLKSQDDAIAKKPSLGALLASPERDYIISNKGDEVPIHTLEEKVVALYFYEDGSTDWFTEKLKMVYKELAEKKANFEVVLIYLYNTNRTYYHTDEKSFWEKFKTMPWLALPFRDPSYRKLMRLFCYPRYNDSLYEPTRLVIVGPRGEFIEPWGASMLISYNIEAYPFTREKVAHLLIEKVKELKLEMLWDPNTVFRGRKDATKVELSQLAGKRIILFFEGSKFDQDVVEFLKTLKEMYLNKKGTDDEFEVIYISDSKNESCYAEHVEDVSWLVSPATELLPGDYRLYCCFCQWTRLHPDIGSCLPGQCHGYSSILAFGQDGTLVRKSISPTIEHTHFPFYGGSMEKETFSNYNDCFDYSHSIYQGLLRNSCHDQPPPVIF